MTENFDTYEAYNTLMSIANGIVRNSEGMGLHKFDEEQILKDVDEAAGIVQTANKYWKASRAYFDANQKLKAAKTLDLETSVYEEMVDATRLNRDYWVARMREVIESGRYVKPSYPGGWKKV